MNRLLRSFLLLMTMTSMVFIGSCSYEKAAAPQAPVPVNVVKIQTSTIPVTRDYIGTTSSMANIDIRARVEGFLLSSNFIEGTIVKKGALLFVIDPAPFKAQVDAAQGTLDQSITTAAFNKIDSERKFILYKQKSASEQDSDQATANYKASLAAIETNKANLLQAKINLSYCYMYSPVTGKIGAILVDVGNLVGAPTQTILATVVQLDPIYVSFNPSINDYGEFLKYKKNYPFKVEVTLPQQTGYKFTGKVDFINNQVDTNTSTLLMRSVVDNPENLLLPGLYVNVKLLLGNNPDAILVPSTAIMAEQNMQYVYIVNANQEVATQIIQSHSQYKNNTIIDSGLKPGDLVITENLQKIRPGMKVKPVISTDTKS